MSGPARTRVDPPESSLLALLAEPFDSASAAARLRAFGHVTLQDGEVVLSCDDTPMRASVRDREMPPEGLLDRLRRDPFTRARLDRAQAAVVVEATLPAGAPLRAFQRLYQVGEASTGGRALVWYDFDKQQPVDREEVHLFSHTDVTPSAEDAIGIDCVFEEPGFSTYWMHTHGLARLGVPDIEAFDVPKAHRAEGGGLINDVADWLIEHGPPSAGAQVPLGDATVWLEPLRAQIGRLPPGTFGKDLADRSPDEQRLDRRVALVLPRRTGLSRGFRRTFTHEIASVLEARTAATVRPMKRSEGERLAAIARRTLPLLTRLWKERRDDWRFFVQLGLPTASDPDVREHLWFEAAAIDDREVEGRLDNEPEDVPSLRLGDVARRELALTTRWSVRIGDDSYGPRWAHRLLDPAHRVDGGLEPDACAYC